jgi:glycosyltransferase involved in cell wall biosynthesis
MYNALDNFMLRRIRHILVVSEKSRELICKLGINRERVIVVPNGFDMSRAEEKVNRPTGAFSPIRIVAAGRLSFEKGYDILVEAISYLDKDLPKHCFFVYGEGPERNNLRNQSEKLGVADRIQFCGFVDDLLSIFREMDFMVLPSRSEGMPNVVLEAWSQQLGVLATSVGGLPEMITDGHNGFLVKPSDPRHLADKLTKAIRSRSRMHEFGEKGLETLKERYSFTRQSELLSHIYETILDGKSI